MHTDSGILSHHHPVAPETADPSDPARVRFPTTVACGEVFEDLEARLRAKARRVALALGVDPREAWADAQLYFVEAYRLHYRDLSRFEQRADFAVWSQIRRAARTELRRRKRLRRAWGVDPDRLPAAPTERAGDLPPDVAALAALVLDPPAELEGVVGGRPRAARVAVARYAAVAWGWGPDRIESALEAAGAAFSF